ncbi:MAG TPA: hypothetical protein VF171_00750, partial [Trueperaceae bacterium]
AAAVRHVLTQPETHTLESAVCIRHAENLVGASFMSWEAFVAGAEEVSVETLKARRLASEYPDEVADIIYTSGTSGLP